MGAAIALREPDGADDLFLHESVGTPPALGLAFLSRLAPCDVASLTVTDFEILLLQLRAARLGPRMHLAFACPHCREIAEIVFSVSDYIADIRPKPVPGVMADAERPGWFSLGGATFRLPTARYLAAVADRAEPGRELAALCLDETARQPRHRARVERAMACMAPEVSRSVAGTCPACGAAVRAGFAVARVVMAEQKRAAAAVHDEVDLIARAYHWPQAEILALPRARRHAYAERIRRGGAQPGGAQPGGAQPGSARAA
jgi:hypothetical protein